MAGREAREGREKEVRSREKREQRGMGVFEVSELVGGVNVNAEEYLWTGRGEVV